MTTAGAAAALAFAAALADLAAPASPSPSGLRRLLRALPAGALAAALRLADAPTLPAVALLAFAVADALALDGREPGVGGWIVALLAPLLLAAALGELASPRVALREPWRMAEAAAVLAGGVVLAVRSRDGDGELGALRPVAVLLWTAAAAAAGAQPLAALAPPFSAGVAFRVVAAALEALRRRSGGAGRTERVLRSAGAFALALPLLPPFLA